MRQTILVVDDEAPTRKYVSANLRARGYEVLLAADGGEALKAIAEHPLDLLLLDIGLPGPDGLEVLAAVRREIVRYLRPSSRDGRIFVTWELGAASPGC
jgi:CheY-like chemotaxis protein